MNDKPAGCQLQTVEDSACHAWLDHVAGRGGAPAPGYELRWLLAHCDDGVIWGRRDATGWRLSCEPFPDISPRLELFNAQQLRLFGPECELLLWRVDGGFRGRLLTHGPAPADPTVNPEEQCYVLVGDRVVRPTQDGFTVVGDGRGSRHAVPLVCPESAFPAQPRQHPLRLKVWHYFTADSESGLVRVVACRLADVRLVAREKP
jgi:CRISPR-associated protein (TIGR03984 family)